MEASEVGYASLQDDVCNLESVGEAGDWEGRCVCVVELEVNLFSFGGVDDHPLVRSDLIVDETYAGGHSPQSSFSRTTGLTMRSWPARAISRSSPQSGQVTISPFTASSGTETRASQSGHFSLDKRSPPILLESKFSWLANRFAMLSALFPVASSRVWIGPVVSECSRALLALPIFL